MGENEERINERKRNINRDIAVEMANFMFVPSSLVILIRRLDKEGEFSSKFIPFAYAAALGGEGIRLGAYYKAIEYLVN